MILFCLFQAEIALQKAVNTELQKVDKRMHFDHLYSQLNFSKTSYILTGPSGKWPYDFNVKINDNTISQTSSMKYQGVYIVHW